MKKYNCSYQNSSDYRLSEEKIEASSPRDAYEKYIAKVGVFEDVVFVETGLLSAEHFDDHLEGFKIEEKRKLARLREAEIAGLKKKASNLCNRITSLSDPSYLLLSPDEKVEYQEYFNELGGTLEDRGLYEEEAEFARIWIRLKDRELGQSLLAQAEAQKPKDQQGTSQLGKLALAGVALSTMKLSQDIGAVSDQVENISEGFGFEG